MLISADCGYQVQVVKTKTSGSYVERWLESTEASKSSEALDKMKQVFDAFS